MDEGHDDVDQESSIGLRSVDATQRHSGYYCASRWMLKRRGMLTI